MPPRSRRLSPSPNQEAGDSGTVLATLHRLATKKTRDGMIRYGIPSDNALGVTVGDLKKLAEQIGRNHDLAAALWKTKVYEARMLACFIDDPAQVTSAQMDQWCRDFDSWAICDTACFALFDRTLHAWKKVAPWAKRREEFIRRAGFALLACLAGHDKTSGDEPFAKALLLVEPAAIDDRNFVKKGVNWALRSVGRRSPLLHAASVEIA